MSALAKRVVNEVTQAKEPDLLVHVRFHPNADIAMVDERPQHISLHEWHTRPCEGASNHYRALAGGRGFFRIPRSTFDPIKAKA
jgi:hypothetical protein